MDTRFWGPPGWKLLHAIASDYPDNPTEHDHRVYQTWFSSLPHVLPCIYCRRSLAQYYRELPLEGSCTTSCPFLKKKRLMRWIYDIHNMVNDKLRNQGLHDQKDPKYTTCCQRYRGHEAQMACEGWDFLYAIAMNYPETPQMVTMKQEMNYYLFFRYLIHIFPDRAVAKKMSPFRPPTLTDCIDSY